MSVWSELVILKRAWAQLKTVNFVNPRRIIDLYDLPYLNVVMLIPPDMRLHLTKHKIQALSPHVRSSRRDFCGSSVDKFCTSLVPTKGQVASYLIFSLGKTDVRKLPYPNPRSERRAYFMEGGQSTRWLRYVESNDREAAQE